MNFDALDDEAYLSEHPVRQRVEKPRVESKATSRRGELQERIMRFLNYHQPKVFGIRTAHLDIDTLEYMLSTSKAWRKNGPALFWKMLRESTPR